MVADDLLGFTEYRFCDARLSAGIVIGGDVHNMLEFSADGMLSGQIFRQRYSHIRYTINGEQLSQRCYP